MEENPSQPFSKQHWYSIGLPETLRRIIWTSAIIVIGLCIFDLIGWLFDLTVLKSIGPNWEPMSILTSICLIVATIALILTILNVPDVFRKTIPQTLAIFIILISLVVICNSLFKVISGDKSQIAGIPFFESVVVPPFRIPMLISFYIFFIGVIILLLVSFKNKTTGLVHILIIPIILISYYNIVSYIIINNADLNIRNISLAINTNVAFLGISVVILAMKPDSWLLKAFTSSQIGGITARRLLPSLLVLPVVIGWLRIKGEHYRLFQSDEGVVIVAMTYTISFLILVWLTARSVNIIDRKRRESEEALRLSEQRLKYHFENSPLAIVEWNSDFIVINWSIEAVSIFGFEKEDVLGKNINSLNLIYEEDVPIVESTMEILLTGKELKVVSENRNYTQKKDIINCIWYNSVLVDQNGKMSSVMSLVEDVTERRRIEQKVVDRTKELEIANNQLVELNATKDKFFNIVAHDLKNPFTSLMGSSELLYENIHSMSPGNIKKLASILNDSAKGGYSILQNLLDWSRSQTGLLKISPQKINLKNIVNENISNLQLPATNKEITLKNESEEDIYVLTDKNMINTILRNLLSNAIKFTRKGGNVTVNIITEADKFIIQVKDNGIGIYPDKIEKLFNLETKHTEPGTEKEQGTGLGLKLCKEFVEKLGGTIRVESIENEGSKFSFSIPLKV